MHIFSEFEVFTLQFKGKIGAVLLFWIPFPSKEPRMKGPAFENVRYFY